MIAISYTALMCTVSLIWLLLRAAVWYKQGRIVWKRELQLLLVYICIVVSMRFTFFPFGKIDGVIQPLLFDRAQLFPPRINMEPFIHLMDYPEARSAWLNLIGNIAMFIPMGIVWPSVFKELNCHWKVLAAGAAFSLCIEIMQLPFFDRVSDIDDLLLNSFGYLIGYGIYLLVKRRKK